MIQFMYKCDVDGCDNLEVVQGDPLLWLPTGWQIVRFVVPSQNHLRNLLACPLHTKLEKLRE